MQEKMIDYKDKYYEEIEKNRNLTTKKCMLNRENNILKEELSQANKTLNEYSLLLLAALKKPKEKMEL